VLDDRHDIRDQVLALTFDDARGDGCSGRDDPRRDEQARLRSVTISELLLSE